MEDLLEEARIRYPFGTKYIPALGADNRQPSVVRGSDIGWYTGVSKTVYQVGECIHEMNSPGLLYCKGKWAEIVGSTELDKARKIIYED